MRLSRHGGSHALPQQADWDDDGIAPLRALELVADLAGEVL